MAITGGAVAAAALATAPGAMAGTAAPCAVAAPCEINSTWGFSATGNPEYPVRGMGAAFTWKYLTIANPGTENVRLRTIVSVSDWGSHASIIEAGVVKGTLNGTLYSTPTYYWSETNGSTTTYHPYTDGPAVNTSYKARITNTNGDGCWDIELGPHTASTCIPGATTSSVGLTGNGQVLAVDDSGYKTQSKVELQGYMTSAGQWAQWPNAPYPASPYKHPSVGIGSVTGHECYTQPYGASGTTYMAAAFDATHTTTPTTMCSAAGW
jgi:hypothetical protein